MTTQPDREKLREEWMKWYRDTPTINKHGISLTCESIADFWLSKLESAHTETLQQVEEIYSHLVSEEARMAKEGLNSDFENGYFEAIDDVAKFIRNKLSAIRNIEL